MIGIAALSLVLVWLARSLLLSAAATKAVLSAQPAAEREAEVYRTALMCMQAMTGAGALLLVVALLQLVAVAAVTLLQLVEFTRG